MRELPGRGLVEPHQRRMQLERPGHAEIERDLQRPDGVVATIGIAGIIGLAHAADDVLHCRADRPAPRRRSGTPDYGRARKCSAVRPAPISIATSRVNAVSESRQRRDRQAYGFRRALPPNPAAALDSLEQAVAAIELDGVALAVVEPQRLDAREAVSAQARHVVESWPPENRTSAV